MGDSCKEIRKAITALAIETALLKIGKSAHDKVIYTLYNDYHCYLSDCYENPEYLKKVLQDLYEKSSIAIIESIKKQLERYAGQREIESFIAEISDQNLQLPLRKSKPHKLNRKIRAKDQMNNL